jgi:UDP-glucose 4-epimerase
MLHRASAPGRRVAITGACSFLGRSLVSLLERDAAFSRVVTLDIETPRTAGPKTRAYRVDLTQPTVGARVSEILRAEQIDALVHLAFLSTPTNAEGFAHELESVGTMHVMRAARESGVGRVVMSSTTTLYGPHAKNPNFLTERAPLRGIAGCRFLGDKIEAERELERLVVASPSTRAVALRFAPILGPTVKSWVTRWLSRRVVPVLFGYDPLVQLVHELDAVRALRAALETEASGTYNIVGQGVLPLSTIVKLAGRNAMPVPGPLLRVATSAMFAAGLGEAPPFFVAFLRHLCVADGALAARELGFTSSFTVKEAALDFGGALRLRDARLLRE